MMAHNQEWNPTGQAIRDGRDSGCLGLANLPEPGRWWAQRSANATRLVVRLLPYFGLIRFHLYSLCITLSELATLGRSR